MPLAGLEPARCYPLDFESSASANSATAAIRLIFSDQSIISQIPQKCKKIFPGIAMGIVSCFTVKKCTSL